MVDKKKDGLSLGASFVAGGLLKKAEQHLEDMNEAEKRGSQEVAETHLSRGQDALKRLGEIWQAENPEPDFPRLTAEENSAYYAAKRRMDNGQATEADIDVVRRLGNKAAGN